MENVIFENWQSIGRTCIVGILAYFLFNPHAENIPKKDVISNEGV